MTIYAYGHGITTCTFCESIVRYRIEGRTLTILGREGTFTADSALFCSPECESASRLRLDESVNA